MEWDAKRHKEFLATGVNLERKAKKYPEVLNWRGLQFELAEREGGWLEYELIEEGNPIGIRLISQVLIDTGEHRWMARVGMGHVGNCSTPTEALEKALEAERGELEGWERRIRWENGIVRGLLSN